MNQVRDNIRKLIALPIFTIIFSYYYKTQVMSADGATSDIKNNIVYTGTVKLLNDIMGALQGIGAIVGIVSAIYFFIRLSHSDEQDQKMWRNRIKITIISVIAIFVVAGLIKTIVQSYYRGNIQ